MADFYPLVSPFLRLLPAETAHGLTLFALRHGLVPGVQEEDDPVLRMKLWGLEFSNPVGLAAGFDKNAEALGAIFEAGFGFVEAGTVTPRPQPGNPRPRLFRLPDDKAIINRMGFNNKGLVAFTARLKNARASGVLKGIVGANLGRNKASTDAAKDYARGVAECVGLADYLVVNISSPNTPGLRELQRRPQLKTLMAQVMAARDGACLGKDIKAPPILVKIAPDLTMEERRDIAEVAMETGIDGLIISNTSTSRPPNLKSRHRRQSGGLSGKPIFALSTEVLRDIYRQTKGGVPLIGVGGISSGEEAYAKIRAGASLVQLYAALVYQGPALVGQIKRDMAGLLKRDGFSGLKEAIGADHR